jgi:hypothetical protein
MDPGCDDGEYCNYPADALCGAADGTGVCTEKPEACDLQYQPVCGCDDQTYGNACAAALAGVSVVSEGECETPPTSNACGSRGLPDCAADEYCNYPLSALCGAADAPGTCASKPDVCGNIYAPVCGCDDQTYGNACEAAAAGVSVQKQGECSPVTGGAVCGGLRGAQCPAGEYCDFPPDAICGFADATGICADIPQGCTKEYDPVCGCNGETYGNACMAAAAGVSVASSGECLPPSNGGGDCGGLLGLACPADQFCSYQPGDLCGAADATGTCEDKPDACDAIYDPVCGCDGKTYDSACTAEMAGVSVAEDGPC